METTDNNNNMDNWKELKEMYEKRNNKPYCPHCDDNYCPRCGRKIWPNPHGWYHPPCDYRPYYYSGSVTC